MQIQASTVAAIALATLGLGRLDAQAVNACDAFAKVDLGSWSELQVTGGNADGARFRFAVVSKDQAKYWYEIRTTDKKGNVMVMQMLVPGFPFDGKDIDGMIMAKGNDQPMRMPGIMMGMMKKQMAGNPGMDHQRACAQAQVLGSEDVTVPSGTFHTVHLKDANGGEAWVSRDVPFGTVRAVTKNGEQFQLTGHGSDAQSSIKQPSH